MSEPSNDDGPNGPWLDMSAYPTLPPEDAVDGRVLATLRTVLRAPEVTPPPADAWDRAVHAAVTGGHPAADHDATAQEAVAHEDDPSHENSVHEDAVHEEPVHEDPVHQPGWPAGHHAGPVGLGGPGGVQDPHDDHDSHDGGGHW